MDERLRLAGGLHLTRTQILAQNMTQWKHYIHVYSPGKEMAQGGNVGDSGASLRNTMNYYVKKYMAGI